SDGASDLPTADFSGTPLAICAGSDVTFTNASTAGSSPIVSYLWDFGDGFTGNQPNPVHEYNLAGLFPVTLIATDVNGCQGLTQKNAYVQVNNTPSADFTANNTLSCTTPFPVNFVTVNPVVGTTHQWNLGNGSLPVVKNPTTTYNNTGSYTVTHIVTDPVGCSDTVTKVNYIQVGSPQINFQVSSAVICAGESVSFNCGGAPGSIISWNFGNGQNSANCAQTVIYPNPGTYIASLTLTDPSGCSYSASQPITVNPRPVVDFTISDTLLCEAPHIATLTSTGSAGVTYNWGFGDGATGTGATVSHTWPTLPINSLTGQPYFWDISLQVTNQFGCVDALTKPAYLNTGQT
ncbi:MAG: PKD domain-containing protein, partial [Bacteroidota bacterium]